ncbi:CoA pyrophosphatase [Pseudotenacibaculum sp. MALMAid0570]|uniref:NUDIX hydrolase n=1 Tax=Pseudotenacibaculum sp. MALMAid0570 TaxID=3143938 RepID=UPI0032DE38B3
MKFQEFLDNIHKFKSIPLGGLEAQFKLAPKLRLKYDAEKIEANNPKRAAVLALFYPNQDEEATFLLTQRASYKGTHSAQISFPGGKIEERDILLVDTAIREANEEVGIIKDDINIIREITDVYIPPSNFLATPFIGYTDYRPNFIINQEVASTIEVLVSDLLDDSNIDSIKMNTSYMKNVDVPCFKLNDYIVWGATGMMLSEIKEILK